MAPRAELRAGQVLLHVRAVGLNFRDVLNVLDMYPGDPGEPGSDVSGIVAALGPGTEHLHRQARPCCSVRTFFAECSCQCLGVQCSCLSEL